MGGERKRERPSRDGAEEYSTNNNSISFSLLLYIAYLPVHSRANFVYFSRSVLYTRAEKEHIYLWVLKRQKILPISGTRGSSGFGSVRREQIESKTLLIVNAGDHCDLEKDVRVTAGIQVQIGGYPDFRLTSRYLNIYFHLSLCLDGKFLL